MSESFSMDARRLSNLSLDHLQEIRRRAARKAGARGPELRPRERGGDIPLSHAQERLWFLHELGFVGPAYNMARTLKLEGILSTDALAKSIAELVRRHEILRTRVEALDGRPVQRIENAPFTLKVEDLSGLKHTDRRAALQHLSHAEARRPFNLSVAPLMRATLIKLQPTEHVLLLVFHHFVFDGWSWGVLQSELLDLYRVHAVQGVPSNLPELPIQYADYAMWHREWMQGERLDRQLDYWRERLRAAPPEIPLPTDRPRPAVESFKGAVHRFDLAADVFERAKELAQRQGATVFMVVLAAYTVLLSRWSGQQDIVVGVPLAGRTKPTLENLIGLFVNTVALRISVADSPTYLALLDQAKTSVLDAYKHQDLPFELLVKELRPERNLARQPIFQVAIALQNYPDEDVGLADLKWRWEEIESATSHFDLTLYLSESSRGLRASFEYATDLFDEATIERIASSFNVLLDEIVAEPARPIDRLALLDRTEAARVLHRFNETDAARPDCQLVHQMFQAQVRQTPHAVALHFGDERLTYQELSQAANQLAHALIAEGVRPDSIVAVFVERSPEMIIAILGILKAGGAYLPLDISQPTERLAYMLHDCAPSVVLTQEPLVRRLPALGARVIVLDRHGQALSAQPQGDPADDPALTPANLAYVIYTSGSTGQPKGVMIEHRGICNLAHALKAELNISSTSRVLQFASLSFDASTWEWVMTLCAGGTLCLAHREDLMPGEPLLRTLQTMRITHATLPPVAVAAMPVSEQLPDLGTLIVGGEACPAAIVERWAPGRRFINAYGPTETTVCATLHLCSSSAAQNPPIGRPIQNTRIYVLDGNCQPVPVGVVGEIYIGGVGVARGYLNRPELTGARFVCDPFRGDAQARMYRAGDLGRWRGEGVLEYLGRNDGQIKIRGYRIELGEIESQLLQHDAVRAAALVASANESGDKRLIAYVDPDPRLRAELEDADDALENRLRKRLVPELRDYLKSRLPTYMIPSVWVILEQMPLTSSGKVDRRALPEPKESFEEAHEYVAPGTDTECALAEAWKQVLGREHVGVNDNFFDLGGHSLLATQVAVRLKSIFSIDVPIRMIFEFPTLGELSREVDVMREARLKSEAGTGSNLKELLAQVSSLSESEVRRALSDLRTRGL